MPHQIRIVPYADVAADLATIKARQDTSYPSSRTQRFCTAGHHLSDIIPTVIETSIFKHEIPAWEPYGYVLWHPLIARSQKLQPDQQSFVGQIPGFLWEDIMRCHSSWFRTGAMGKEVLDDLIESWRSTTPGKQISQLFDAEKRWFIRLDQMSPKDSPLGGKLPCTTLEDVITKVCSSMRAYGCLQREMEDAKVCGRDVDVKIVVNRWDEEMDAAYEFRVFVPPPRVRLENRRVDEVGLRDLRISAISQYRWVLPFQSPFPDRGVEETAERVYDGAQGIFRQISEFAEKEVVFEIREMLLRYGFSFDVIVKKGGEMQLVELNPFGALSGCGACLFNWVKDGKMLYGIGGDDIEFTVTLEEHE